MKLRKNRVTERAAVNAVRAFFEECGCTFQEVDGTNDYGKDAYVDLVEGEQVTGLCVALQIKGGNKYRRKDSYAIPLDEEHAMVWRTSTVPIMGIVYDPLDKQMRWCNISDFLTTPGSEQASYIPVSSSNILTSSTLHVEFRLSIEKLQEKPFEHPILQLCSSSELLQESALYDCFGLGRSDARVLIALRYIMRMLKDDILELAINVLAHITPHPDIWWTSTNWIPKDVCDLVKPHLQWDTEEIEKMLTTVAFEKWRRGDSGQDLYMILVEDPNVSSKMQSIAVDAKSSGNDDLAIIALYLTLYWAGENAPAKYEHMLSLCADFRTLWIAGEIEYLLQDSGYVTLFE